MKKLIYILIISIILVGSFSFFLGKKSITGNAVINNNLVDYRSEEIPEECRLPEYENNLEEWKEHLSHHQNTLYCLNYYKEI